MRRLLILCAAFAVFAPGLALAWPAHVCRVVDGDTLCVAPTAEACADRTARTTLRLYGVDAPEHDQPSGAGAATRLRELAGQTVDVEPRAIDRYGRTVALVRTPDLSAVVNARLVLEGWAWVYPRYCTAAECPAWRGLEAEARAARSGLWADPSPVPPWKWRYARKHHAKRRQK